MVRSDASGPLSSASSPVCYAHGLHVTVFTPLITGGSVTFPLNPTALDVEEVAGAISRPPGIRQVRRCTGSCSTKRRRFRTRNRSIDCDLSFPAGRRLRVSCARAFAADWACRSWSTMARAKGCRFQPTYRRPGLRSLEHAASPPRGAIKVVAESGREVSRWRDTARCSWWIRL